jgi:predicted alpha/beta superfamily hydrolase
MEITTFEKDLPLMSSGKCTIRIMTPTGYENGSRRYPVIYINDGQDVFEDKDIIWGDCSLDYKNYYEHFRKYLPELIIVALCCPQDRSERTALYTPFELKEGEREGVSAIHGKGKDYSAWIVNKVKPWVDKNYRTLSDAGHTAIMGYSTGGTLAVYASLAYPEVFTRVIAMSNAIALWKNSLSAFFKSVDGSHISRLYIDVGTNEFGRFTKADEFVRDARWLKNEYENLHVKEENILYRVFPDAIHSQRCWKLRFPDALRWIFPDNAPEV